MIDENKTSLDPNGFARIAPKSGSFIEWTTDKNMKALQTPRNLMFSIENLAWADNLSDLHCDEVGPGDSVGTRGRMMWFPPYGITITDNSTVNWASTNFVGRGEPIYTYNNAERTMTLQFKIITDHPSILNALKKEDTITLEQFFSATGGKVNKTIREKLGYKYEKLGLSAGLKDKAEVSIIENGKVISLGHVNSSVSIDTFLSQFVQYSADTISFLDNATGNTVNTRLNNNGISTFVDKLYDQIDVVSIEIVGSSSANITAPAHCAGATDTSDIGEDRIK